MEQIPLIVTTEWLEKRLGDPNLLIVDATVFMELSEKGGPPVIWSGKASYEKDHIPGAIHIDIVKDLSAPDSAVPFTVPTRDYFIHKMTQLGIGNDKQIVVYDQGALVGNPVAASYWASRLAWQMKYEGLENVAVLEGGLPKWKKENRPMSGAKESYAQTNFTGQRRSEMLATKEDVKQAMDDDNTILINSLSPEDYRGESDSYARKGHIPSSHNIFFGIHVDQQSNKLYDDAVLREQFESIDALNPTKKVITYCGGGLAATWTALMLNKLGQKNVAVYDGSLNEWVSDSTCPLVTES